MTRTKARELAIRLIYAQAASDSETLLEDFLEPCLLYTSPSPRDCS